MIFMYYRHANIHPTCAYLNRDEVQPEYLTTVELSASGSGYEELDQITQQSPRKQQHVCGLHHKIYSKLINVNRNPT